MKNWSRARWAWFAISFTLGLYVAGVGINAFVRSRGFAISTAEMFYGPAITLASSWVLVGAIHWVSRQRKTKA